MRYIIVGNSVYSCFQKIYVPQKDDYLIGVDEGIFTILNSGYCANEAWGDFDNLSDNEVAKIKNIHLYNRKKNETDLELVLMNLHTCEQVFLYDVTGGRLDHEMVNFLLLKKFQNLDLYIIDEYNEITYLHKPKKYYIYQGIYRYCSFFTFNEATIEINDAEYKLPKTKITINDTYTISNTFICNQVTLTLYSGEIILIKSI